MHRFTVWAPRKRTVEAVVDGRHIEMTRAQGGWWEAADEGAHPGSRYAFSIDGGEPRPDPRSQSQPEGVLAPSALVDHGAFRWTDSAWHGRRFAGSIIYELHVGTFTHAGTFAGVIERLPHLVGLGVDTVELMPVAEFSGDRGWGYDGVDLYSPHHAYGGPDGLKRLVDACHAAGLAVVLDVVYNHLGPVGNFLAEFGPYFSARLHTSWGDAVNFDGPGSDEVRRFVIDNAAMWIRDYHVDGLRLDAVHVIADGSPVHILQELGTEMHRLGADMGRVVWLIAETDLNDPVMVRSPDAGGHGLDAAWSDDWHHALHAALSGERVGYYNDFGSLSQLGKALRQAWVFDGMWSAYRKRTRGARPVGLPPHTFVVATQNHDQVGNRAVGDRLVSLAGVGGAKAAAALLLTSPFTPLLFQGEEWGSSSPFQYFTDHADPQLGRAVSEGRRREFASFGWEAGSMQDPQDPATFERSKLDWDEPARSPHREMLEWYRRLIALRRRLPLPRGAVGTGVDVTVDEAARRVTFGRDGVVVFANLGDAAWDVELGEGARIVMASDATIRPGGRHVCLPPSSVAIAEVGADLV